MTTANDPTDVLAEAIEAAGEGFVELRFERTLDKYFAMLVDFLFLFLGNCAAHQVSLTRRVACHDGRDLH